MSVALVLCVHQRGLPSSGSAHGLPVSAVGVVANAGHFLVNPPGFFRQREGKKKDLKRNMKKDRRRPQKSSENSQASGEPRLQRITTASYAME